MANIVFALRVVFGPPPSLASDRNVTDLTPASANPTSRDGFKARYRELAKALHPDKARSKAAEEAFKGANNTPATPRVKYTHQATHTAHIDTSSQAVLVLFFLLFPSFPSSVWSDISPPPPPPPPALSLSRALLLDPHSPLPSCVGRVVRSRDGGFPEGDERRHRRRRRRGRGRQWGWWWWLSWRKQAFLARGRRRRRRPAPEVVGSRRARAKRGGGLEVGRLGERRGRGHSGGSGGGGGGGGLGRLRRRRRENLGGRGAVVERSHRWRRKRSSRRRRRRRTRRRRRRRRRQRVGRWRRRVRAFPLAPTPAPAPARRRLRTRRLRARHVRRPGGD
jgi:hypothetical protein